MKIVADKLKEIDGPLVFCGDLNLKYEAPAMRSLDFLRNLTQENGVKTTLSGLKFNGAVPCDYILVNDFVTVEKFAVIPDIVSDHLGIMAEIEPNKR